MTLKGGLFFISNEMCLILWATEIMRIPSARICGSRGWIRNIDDV